jgi:dihydrofolate reductase
MALMKTQYYAASSLDGFIATADDSLDWLFPLVKIEDTSYPNFIKDVGAIAMGSATYQFLLNHMQSGKTEAERAWPYQQPTWVFTSRKLEVPKGKKITLCSGDAQPVHEQMRLASLGKNIWIMGGGELAGQFYDAGLLDELILQIGSVTLGSGKPVLPRKVLFPGLQLISTKSFGAGMAELRYSVQKS